MPKAVEFAKKNVEFNGVADKVTVICGDLFEPLVPHLDVTQWDLINRASMAFAFSSVMRSSL